MCRMSSESLSSPSADGGKIITRKEADDTSTSTSSMKNSQEAAYTTALLRSLKYGGIKFLRFMMVDTCNNIRCKVVPVDHLLKDVKDGKRSNEMSLKDQVSIAMACCAGVPYDQDALVEGSGIDGKHVLTLQPDLFTLRPLPYAPRTAAVLGTLHDQFNGELSDLCTRGLLHSTIEELEDKFGLGCSVGAELEFCLYDAKTNQPVDNSVFANTTLLNERDDFIEDIYDQLQQQEIPIELIHAESGPGQMELVLTYRNDPVTLVDSLVLARETITAVAHQHGFKALFLPKYDMTKAGNGLHLHLSLYDKSTDQAVFSDPNNGSSMLTKTAESFVEGILQHLSALTALTMPSVNSFRRVGKGCWTGSEVGWAMEDKNSGVRLCLDLASKTVTNAEVKLCDATANPYLALAGILKAGMDGLERSVSLRPSLDDDNDNDGPIIEPLPDDFPKALEHLKRDDVLLTMMGPKLSQAYLAVRLSEAERSSKATLEEEVALWLSRA